MPRRDSGKGRGLREGGSLSGESETPRAGLSSGHSPGDPTPTPSPGIGKRGQKGLRPKTPSLPGGLGGAPWREERCAEGRACRVQGLGAAGAGHGQHSGAQTGKATIQGCRAHGGRRAEGVLPGPQTAGPAAALKSGRNGSVHAALRRGLPQPALQMRGPRPTQDWSQARRALYWQEGGLPLSLSLAGRTSACPTRAWCTRSRPVNTLVCDAVLAALWVGPAESRTRESRDA